jgi:hypothetical protein
MVKERLKSNILEIVNNQLQQNNPKCTKETFIRLQSQGISAENAKLMIAAVLTEEIFIIMKNQIPFNEKNYCERLAKLPDYYVENLANP